MINAFVYIIIFLYPVMANLVEVWFGIVCVRSDDNNLTVGRA